MYKKIKFIDLFCGAGGWSEGMSQQGLQCIYSVDNWKPACVAHSLNHPGIPDDDQPKDILSQEVFAKLKEIVKEHIEKDEDLIIIGSPPCTQFSFSNKAGNGNIVQGMVLVRRFLELIDFVQNELGVRDIPWVMENVPRLKVFMEQECIDEENNIYRFNYVDEEKSYNFYDIWIPRINVLNAADFGAPQKRERVFCGNYGLPKPTHIAPEVKDSSPKRSNFVKLFAISDEEAKALPKWRTVRELLSRFPDPLNKPGDDVPIMDPNYDICMTVKELNDHFYDTTVEPGLELYECQEMKQHHPFYGVMNFPDDLDSACRTLMATEMKVSRETMFIPVNLKEYKRKTCKKTYHEVLNEFSLPDVKGFRRLTIRELASFMGFPWTYQFDGTRTGVKHKQIGNAVCPFISRAFAKMFQESFFNVLDVNAIRPEFHRFPFPEVKNFDFTHKWAKRVYAKDGKKFSKHVRSTKANGQRVDMVYSPNEDSPWKAFLCLGSGKNYHSLSLNGALMTELDSIFEKSNGELVLKAEPLSNMCIDKIENKTYEITVDGSFYDFRTNKCFQKPSGEVRPFSPIYWVEEGVEHIMKELIEVDLDELRELTIPVYSPTFKIDRALSLHTFIILRIVFQVVNLANEIAEKDIDSCLTKSFTLFEKVPTVQIT